MNNRFFVGDWVKWCILATVACAAIFIPLFGLVGGGRSLAVAFCLTAIAPVVMVVATLSYAVLVGNQTTMRFKISDLGVTMKIESKRLKAVNRLAVVLGLLARRPGAIGAGTVAMSQEETEIPWDELSQVRFYPADRVIFLRGDILSRIRVYCSPDNYDTAERMIRGCAPPTVDMRRKER